MITIKHLVISALIITGLNTQVIAQDCRSILLSHANQSTPSFTQEEKKILQPCANTDNWCMLFGRDIANCKNNLDDAATSEIPLHPTTTAPVTTPKPPAPVAPPSTPAAQQKQDVNTTPINNNETTTTTTPSKPKNNQTEPTINWF